MTYPRFLLRVFLACFLVALVVSQIPGCGFFAPPIPKLPPVPGGAGPNHTTVLNWLAFVCTGLAVLSIVLKALVPTPLSTTGGLIAAAVACWTLEYILAKYLWLIALLAVVVVVLVILEAFAGHLNWKDAKRGPLIRWLEKRTGHDWNKNGTVGNGGFTLLELLIVLAVIACLIAVLLSALGKARNQDQTKCLSNLRTIAQEAGTYSADHALAWSPPPVSLGDTDPAPPGWLCPACRREGGTYLWVVWTGAEIEQAVPSEQVVAQDRRPWHPRTVDEPPVNGWGNCAYLDGHAGRGR